MEKPVVPCVFAVGDGKDAASLIAEVINGSLLAVEIRNFLTEEQCDTTVELLEPFEMDSAYLQGQARKIGVSAHNRQNDPQAYFAEARQHPLLHHTVVQEHVQVLLDVFGSVHGHRRAEIATNEKGESYSATIIREFHASLRLHNDFAKREQVGWGPIDTVMRQWAYVIKLSDCEDGNTFFYPKQWRPCHEMFFNREDNYSYNMAVVSDVEEYRIAGPKGTLIVFDCTHYHRVSAVTAGRRYTMGGFVGELPDGQLVMWS